jgi:hypothetical protein
LVFEQPALVGRAIGKPPRFERFDILVQSKRGVERLARDRRVIGKPNRSTGDRCPLGIGLSVAATVLCAVLGSTL